MCQLLEAKVLQTALLLWKYLYVFKSGCKTVVNLLNIYSIGVIQSFLRSINNIKLFANVPSFHNFSQKKNYVLWHLY